MMKDVEQSSTAPTGKKGKYSKNVLLIVLVAIVVCLVAALIGFGASGNLRGAKSREQGASNDQQQQIIPEEEEETGLGPPPAFGGLKTMPNVGFLLSGYDIMFGNPLPTSSSGVLTSDPGFRLPVFTADFSQGLTTQDLRYIIPSGLAIRSCTGTCSLSFTSSIIESEMEYSERLSVKAKVKTGSKVFGAKFSASTDYQKVSSGTNSEKEIVTQSEASCCAYFGEVPDYDLPDFHPTFLAGLRSLTEEFDESIYTKFIEAFGTHYVQKGFMGALYGEQSIISSEARESFESQKLDIRAAASASAFGISASASLQVETDKELARKFRREDVRRSVYTHGAPPPSDGEPATWAQQTINTPAPISIELERIDMLPLPISDGILLHLRQAIDMYCASLVEEGIIGACDVPQAPSCPLPNMLGILCADISLFSPVSCDGCCYKNTCLAYGAGFLPIKDCSPDSCM